MANQQVRVDVFPSILTLEDENGDQTMHSNVRVILTLDHIYVFKDETPKPVLVFEDRLESYTPPIAPTRVKRAADLANRKAIFISAEGTTGYFIGSGSCGCGSRLKSASAASLLPGESSLNQAASSKDSIAPTP